MLVTVGDEAKELIRMLIGMMYSHMASTQLLSWTGNHSRFGVSALYCSQNGQPKIAKIQFASVRVLVSPYFLQGKRTPLVFY